MDINDVFPTHPAPMKTSWYLSFGAAARWAPASAAVEGSIDGDGDLECRDRMDVDDGEGDTFMRANGVSRLTDMLAVHLHGETKMISWKFLGRCVIFTMQYYHSLFKYLLIHCIFLLTVIIHIIPITRGHARGDIISPHPGLFCIASCWVHVYRRINYFLLNVREQYTRTSHTHTLPHSHSFFF